MTDENDNIYQQIDLEVKQAVQRFNVDLKLTDSMATAITARLQKLLARKIIYFPSIVSQEERYAAIKRDFNGKNKNELCKKYGISRSTLYRAIK